MFPRKRALQVAPTRPAASRAFWHARLPWMIPLAISLAVLIAAAFAVPPVRDAATFSEVSEAHLARPAGYVALAPLSNVLDTLTLLSARQHAAVVLGLLALWAAWRVARPRRRRGWRSHIASLATVLAAIVTAYAAAVFLPRPMAYLASHDADILRIDFHSHTAASKDARQAFSVERNRAWHRAGGYDVAYVTDHATVAGAKRGIANNPPAGRDGVVLLQGIEATWMGEHVGILGAERTYRGLLTPNLRNVDARGLTMASAVATREPVVIWNHARELTNKLPPASGPATVGVRAIEISNGAPREMDRIRPKRRQLVALAERHGLALTTGSDCHGWGHAAPNWTLLRLTNWRGLDHDALAAGIERGLRDGGLGATRAVERATADPGTSPVALAFSVVGVPWRMLTTLSAGERLMWLVWTWAITGAVLLRRRRRRGPS